MKLIEFECDLEKIETHQAELSDTIKHAVYEENEALFELLEFSDDRIFLEPSLFCYFLSDAVREKKISLEQSLFGYIHPDKQPKTLNLKSDLFGLINIPNKGYLKKQPLQDLKLSSEQILSELIADTFIDQSTIRICLHPTDQLGLAEGIVFNESPLQSFIKNKTALLQACRLVQNQLPEFWKMVELVTREFVVFNSPNHNSFAAIGHHGTAYFNVEHHLPSAVFFVEDIAHQCGHVIFNALTLDTERYFQVPKESLLGEITKDQNDTRTVYGACHGLFTYNCILYCLDGLIDSKIESVLEHEAIGRMGFYLDKFKLDLEIQNDPRILTEEGMLLYEQFQQSFNIIKNKYEEQTYGLDYSNQPYVFQYDKFQALNPVAQTN